LGQFTVPGRDNLPAAERDRYKTFQVTLPNRPLAKKKGVKTLPSDSYRPRLQLFCRQGSNNNHWAWGPIWKTSDKPVQQWRQEAICRDGSPCGVSFAAIDSL
ncbi:MAG: hypothetical protein R3B72_52290, partial [Polyangiaceae bacterium]